MYTPQTTLYRKLLRQEISKKYPHNDPKKIFGDLKNEIAPVITFKVLAEFAISANIPVEELTNIFAAYDVTEPYLTSAQFTTFYNDDFPDYSKTGFEDVSLTNNQRFILQKFMSILKTKLGTSMNSRWNTALSRNPPNAVNTSLRVSALCRLFSEMNLPFDVSDFIDAIFAFYGQKTEAISFDQFGMLFDAFQ